jgi:hypothetical protein
VGGAIRGPVPVARLVVVMSAVDLSSPLVRRTGRTLFALTLGVYLFTAGASLTTTDAVVTFDVTRNIVEHGSVAMSDNLLGMEAHRGRDGRYYAPFGLGQSLYNVPFYLAARALVTVTGIRLGKPDTVPKAIVALGTTVVVAGIVVELFRLSITLTGSLSASLGAALAMAFGSVLWPYARFGFNQPLAALALLCATHCAIRGARSGSARSIALAGVWLAAGLMTRHEVLLAAAPIGLWLILDGPPQHANAHLGPLAERRERGARGARLLAFAPGVAAGLTLWLVYNAIRFGHPLDSGYLRDPTPGFGSPVVAGALALLFSPGASIVLYSPVVVLALAGLIRLYVRGDRSAALLLLSIPVLFLLFYATLGNWIGGRSYGSRYLVLVLPLFGPGLAVAIDWLAPQRWPRLAVAAVLLLSTLVQLPGVLVDYAKVSQAAAARQGAFNTEARQWQWSASPLALNTAALWTAVPDNLAYVTGRRPPPPIEPPSGDADRSFSQQFSFSLDLWWLYLFYMRALPSWAAGLLVVGFLGFATTCSSRLRRFSSAS